MVLAVSTTSFHSCRVLFSFPTPPSAALNADVRFPNASIPNAVIV
jgi:hypothetical protein